jgi:hypothetical protein
MPSFAEYYPIKCLLDISRRHREAVDSSRVYDGKIIGQDNWDTLSVSTVLAAIAIEASLNDFTLSHCLFLAFLYLQEAFGAVTEQFLRTSIHKKIDLLVKLWPEELPTDPVKDVRKLISIRNRIAHQTGEFRTANETDHGRGEMPNRGLNADEAWHCLKHLRPENLNQAALLSLRLFDSASF